MAAYGQAIGRIIFAVLSTDTDILGMVDAEQIQPVVLYDQAQTSGIFYEVNSVNNTNVKGPAKADLSVVDFQIEVFHPEYEKVKGLAIFIQIALDKLTAGTYGLSGSLKIDGCVMTDVSESFDKQNNFYYCSLGFTARIVPT